MLGVDAFDVPTTNTNTVRPCLGMSHFLCGPVPSGSVPMIDQSAPCVRKLLTPDDDFNLLALSIDLSLYTSSDVLAPVRWRVPWAPQLSAS